MAQLGWPLAFLGVALGFRKAIGGLMQREGFGFEFSGFKVTTTQAAREAAESASEVAKRLADLERRLAAAGLMAPETNERREVSILWVDDFPANNAFLMEKLQSDGARIQKEISTDSAISALSEGEFDLIVSDLGRIENGRDNPWAGRDFARVLRASGRKQPLLIFAGSRAMENRDQLVAAGATAVTDSVVEVFNFVDGFTSKPAQDSRRAPRERSGRAVAS